MTPNLLLLQGAEYEQGCTEASVMKITIRKRRVGYWYEIAPNKGGGWAATKSELADVLTKLVELYADEENGEPAS